ncbi:uncharacterized protein BDR25DRAFT_361597 [Lindgomyces ingoldianus]|uniref:Uncharacterized protein n=1 Tax=Lindgomyces ingoldianus TaxID=673940 RepID=A0ACB6QBU4_9PLEO|nr:uncharacterized protein BDR25DRAFT_361597 [Lindgomyces ingoldianus]KAF2464519.1 hypothetical protein BDR25DRAFT_361597 [Lindgomyces ingoldianus]
MGDDKRKVPQEQCSAGKLPKNLSSDKTIDIKQLGFIDMHVSSYELTHECNDLANWIDNGLYVTRHSLEGNHLIYGVTRGLNDEVVEGSGRRSTILSVTRNVRVAQRAHELLAIKMILVKNYLGPTSLHKPSTSSRAPLTSQNFETYKKLWFHVTVLKTILPQVMNTESLDFCVCERVHVDTGEPFVILFVLFPPEYKTKSSCTKRPEANCSGRQGGIRI